MTAGPSNITDWKSGQLCAETGRNYYLEATRHTLQLCICNNASHLPFKNIFLTLIRRDESIKEMLTRLEAAGTTSQRAGFRGRLLLLLLPHPAPPPRPSLSTLHPLSGHSGPSSPRKGGPLQGIHINVSLSYLPSLSKSYKMI